MNPIFLLLSLCLQAIAVPDSSSRWQRDDSDCLHDESSFLQSHVMVESPQVGSVATGASVTSIDGAVETTVGTQASLLAPWRSLRGTSPQAPGFLSQRSSPSLNEQLVNTIREEGSHHEQEVALLTNSFSAASKGTADMMKTLKEEGQAFEFLIIALLCALVIMPVGFAVSALIFMNFLPSFEFQNNAVCKAKEIALPGGLRALRESLKPKDGQKKRGADKGLVASTPRQTTQKESVAIDVDRTFDSSMSRAFATHDHFARARQALLPHPLSAMSDIAVGPTAVCFAAGVLPYSQRDVALDVRDVDVHGDRGSKLGIRIVIKECGDDGGVMIESEGVPVCSLCTGCAVVEQGQIPPTSRRVDLLRAGSLAPIATLSREDAFDGKLPGRIVARGREGICDVADGLVLFEVLLDSQDRPMSVLLVDGRLIARVSVTSKGDIAVKTEVADDLWLAVAGVIAALKLANPLPKAG